MKTFKEFITEKNIPVKETSIEEINEMLSKLSEDEIAKLKIDLSEKEELSSDEILTLEVLSKEEK